MELKIANKTLNSGTSYTISELFSDDRKVVIPDMQREYCWPSTLVSGQNCSLVTSYLRDLLKSSSKGNVKSRMGLIYAYELPANHIQLCDGQQRITTIYLIIGCLTKLLGKFSKDSELYHRAEDVLISDFERHDDHEPRLQYAIRESTLMFLRDLVSNYFLGDAEDIVSSDWYFSSYKEDPSIRNMLMAIKEIKSNLNLDTAEKTLSYVLNNISFLYFDMQSRKYGEEQFVVLNITGKPLSLSEHLKPRLIGAMKAQGADSEIEKKYSDMWESWEQFFWDHRPKDENHSNFVVDDYLNEFLRWTYICENIDKDAAYFRDDAEKYSAVQKVLAGASYNLVENQETKISELFDTIDAYKTALKFIVDNRIVIDSDTSSDIAFCEYSLWDIMLKDEEAKHATYRLTTRHCATLLPVLAYVKKTNQNGKVPCVNKIIRISRLCWEIAQKYASNYDVVRLCAFIKENGDKVLESLSERIENIFTDSIKKSAEIRLNEQVDMGLLTEYEQEYWKLIHLNTVKGQSAFVFNVLEEKMDADNVRKLAENLRETYERPSNDLRRALLTYTDYYTYSGSSKIGERYCYAKDASYFFDMFHKDNVNNQARADLLRFLIDIQSESDAKAFIKSKLVPHMAPNLGKDSDTWKQLVARLYYDPYWFDYGRGNGYVVWNESRQCGYMLTSYRVTDGSFAKIIPTSQREGIEKLCKKLNEKGDKWSIIEKWKLRRVVEKTIDDKRHQLYLEADFISNDESLGDLCYSISTRNEETWNVFKDILLETYTNADLDISNPQRPYLHIGRLTGDNNTDYLAQKLDDTLDFLSSLNNE